MVNKFENLFLPLVFFTVQFSKSCPTPFGRFRSLKSACLVYQPSSFPSSVFCAFFLIFFLTFPFGSNIPPLGSALPSADFANYTHLSPFVNDFLPFYCAFFIFSIPFRRKTQKPVPVAAKHALHLYHFRFLPPPFGSACLFFFAASATRAFLPAFRF